MVIGPKTNEDDMDKITIITTSLAEERRLKPLINALDALPEVELGHIAWGHHQDAQMDIRFLRVASDDILLENQTNIRLTARPKFAVTAREADMKSIFNKALAALPSDLIILMGESPAAFGAALAAVHDHNLPLAHLQAGESEYNLLGPSYGAGITRLSRLHFTSCKSHEDRLTASGVHPGSIFTVGSLGLSKLKIQGPNPEWGHDFILVSMAPEPDAGSANAATAQAMARALESPRFKTLDWVFHLPEPSGLDNLIHSPLAELAKNHPGKSHFIASLDSREGLSALAHCRTLLGNARQGFEEGSVLKTPMVNVGNLLNDLAMPANAVPAPGESKAIAQALDMALSPGFSRSLATMDSPFFQEKTVEHIKDVLMTFCAQMRARAI